MIKKRSPGTAVTAVHGAGEAKARIDLSYKNTANLPRCQSAKVQRRRILNHLAGC